MATRIVAHGSRGCGKTRLVGAQVTRAWKKCLHKYDTWRPAWPERWLCHPLMYIDTANPTHSMGRRATGASIAICHCSSTASRASGAALGAAPGLSRTIYSALCRAGWLPIRLLTHLLTVCLFTRLHSFTILSASRGKEQLYFQTRTIS